MSRPQSLWNYYDYEAGIALRTLNKCVAAAPNAPCCVLPLVSRSAEEDEIVVAASSPRQEGGKIFFWRLFSVFVEVHKC